jgi:hypothetical protein
MVPVSGPTASTADMGFTIVRGPPTEVPDWLATHVIRSAEPEPGAPSSPVHTPVTSAGPGDVTVPESLPHPAAAPMRTTITERHSVFIACSPGTAYDTVVQSHAPDDASGEPASPDAWLNKSESR